MLLISLAGPAAAGEGALSFADPLEKRTAFPVPPGAVPDHGYARLERYVIAFMYGLDNRRQQVDAWYFAGGMPEAKTFYEATFGYEFACEVVDHQEFMKQHWTLFLDATLEDTEGFYEHCASGTLDLFSPVYNYALKSWQTGTMIVFRR